MSTTTLSSPAEQTASSTAKSLTPGVELTRLTAGEFIRLHSFKQIEKTLNANTNGYPFVQFYTADNVCHCIYFSKNAAAIVEEMDMDKGSIIPSGWLNNFKFMWTQCNAAEEGFAWKAVSPNEGESRRADLGDYL